MFETGKVAKIEKDKAIVNLSAGEYCDTCPQKIGHPAPEGLAGRQEYRICVFDDGAQPSLRVDNNIGAKIGDRVEVFIPDGMISKLSFAVFVLPIMTFLIGYFFAWFFSRSEILSAISGTITFVLTFYALFIYEKKLNQIKKETLPYISKILENTNSNNLSSK